MSGVQTNLVGAIVEVSRMTTKWERKDDSTESVAVDYSTLINRGLVRAVTATPEGYLVVWVEELSAAESACWFGENPLKVEWENGDYYHDTPSRPGLLRESKIYAGENAWVELFVIDVNARR